MAASTTFNAPFLHSLLPPNTKILRPRILFKVNTTDIENHYIIKNMCRCIINSWRSWIHCIICNGGWHFPPSHYHRNFIYRRPHYFCLGIYNAFQNTILPNPAERVYLSLPHISVMVQKKMKKHPLASINHKELRIKTKKNQETKPSGKLWYDLLKSIFITVKIIRSYYNNTVFSCLNKNYK